MPQMNDTNQTELNLTKTTLLGLNYPGEEEMKVKFKLDEVEVETTLTYDSTSEARDDYQMLIDMLNASGQTKKLLQEGSFEY
jgi:hypothetical protein